MDPAIAECRWQWPGQFPWVKVADGCPAEERCDPPNYAGWWIGQPVETPCLA